MNQKSPTGKSLNIFPANSFHSFVDSDEAVKDPAVYSVTHTTKGENPDVTHDSAYSIQHSPGTGLQPAERENRKQQYTMSYQTKLIDCLPRKKSLGYMRVNSIVR